MSLGSLSLRSKVIASILIVGTGSLLTAVLSVQGPLRVLLEEHRAAEDAKTARLVADELAHAPGGLAAAASVGSRVGSFLEKRVTVIALDGKVLFDTDKPAAEMENHAHRPEVEDARAHGTGWFARTSATVGKPFLYVAARIERDRQTVGFLRLATPLDEVDEAVDRQRRAMLVAALVAAMIAVPGGAVAASLALRKLASMAEVADQIGHGELGRRIDVPGDDEIGRIGQAVNLLADRLEEKLVRLTRDRALLVTVLDAVGEGLAFVDERGYVLASNGAFRRLAGPGMLPEGQLLREVIRDPVIEEAIRRALESVSPQTVEVTTAAPAREVRFRVLPTTFANLGTIALLLTEDLSANPRVETVRVESAAFLTSSLANVKGQLPREATFALELSRAAILLDQPPAPAEVVLMGELVRVRAADEAPAVYVARARAETGLALLRLELGVKPEEALPATIEVEPTRVALVLEAPKPRTAEWAVPRTSESLDLKLRSLARKLALAHFESAGAEVDDSKKRLVIGFPRA